MTSGPARPAAVRPADRYGDEPSRGRRLALLSALGVLVAAFLGWVLWAGLGAAGRDLYWDDVGYDVVDDTTVEVTFSVSKPPAATAVCTLEALNSRHAPVGVTTVEVGPAADSGVIRTATVRTAERAVTGIVDVCRLD